MIALFQYMINVSTKFLNNSSKTMGGVRDTKLPIFCTQTDGQINRLLKSITLPKTFGLCV